MRKFFLLLSAVFTSFALTPAYADNYDLTSKVISAEIFGQGSLITRSASVDVPKGRHTLNFRLPSDVLDGSPMQIKFSDGAKATVVSTSSVLENTKAFHIPESPDLIAALTALETARADFRAVQEKEEAIRSTIAASKLQLDLLKSVANGGGFGGKDAALDVDRLNALIKSLATSSIQATTQISTAQTALAVLRSELKSAQKAVEQASQTVEALRPNVPNMGEAVITLDFEDAFAGLVFLTIAENTTWEPIYRLSLAQDADKGQLTLLRQAKIYRNGSYGGGKFEDWNDSKITLSTAKLNESMAPWIPREQLLGLQDKFNNRKVSDYSSTSLSKVARAPQAEPMVEALDAAQGAVFSGQTVRFDLGGGHKLSWRDDTVQMNIDSISIPLDLYALANAPANKFAYLFSDLKNKTGGILLAGSGILYRDGALIGSLNFPQLLPGQTESIGLGPLYGLQVKHRTLDAQKGESGFITSSTDQSRNYRTTITSSLDYPIELHLIDVVPTSQDEALQITMRAKPRPSDENRKGKRGVLQWNLDMAAGQTSTVDFGYSMKWPAEKQLQQQ